MALTRRDKVQLSQYVRGLLQFSKESLENEMRNSDAYNKAKIEAEEFANAAGNAVRSYQGNLINIGYNTYVSFYNVNYLTFTFNRSFGCSLVKERSETLSQDDIDCLNVYHKKRDMLAVTLKNMYSSIYGGFLDAVLDVPFIDTLSDCGKLPVTNGEIQRRKKFPGDSVSLLKTDEVRNIIRTQLFKERLENNPVPRITSLSPFEYETK